MLFYLLLDERMRPYPIDIQVLSVFEGGTLLLVIASRYPDESWNVLLMFAGQ
jgi:hypothetical protein